MLQIYIYFLAHYLIVYPQEHILMYLVIMGCSHHNPGYLEMLTLFGDQKIQNREISRAIQVYVSWDLYGETYEKQAFLIRSLRRELQNSFWTVHFERALLSAVVSFSSMQDALIRISGSVSHPEEGIVHVVSSALPIFTLDKHSFARNHSCIVLHISSAWVGDFRASLRVNWS